MTKPSDVPVALRERIKAMYDTGKLPAEDIARVLELPTDWIKLFIVGTHQSH